MKRYYNREETPLAFHKFVWYVLLPLGFICVIVATILIFCYVDYFNWGGALLLLCMVILLSLTLTCFIGFFKWKAYAWYSLFIIFSINPIVGILEIIYDAIYLPVQIGKSLAELVVQLIYVILIGIYYIKRRPLFFPKLQAENAATAQAPVMHEMAVPNLTQNSSFCHECGTPLSKGSKFCSSCGTPIAR